MIFLTPNINCFKMKDLYPKMPNLSYCQPLPTSKTKKPRMTNLPQENKEIESPRTNCPFGFLPTRKMPTQKNQKSNFISNAQRLNVSLIFKN
jgi:hypothetical protein